MKNITIIALLALITSFTACYKTTTASLKVKNAFALKFPKATHIKWEKESDTEWEAEFILNGKEHSANFTLDGSWVNTEYEATESEIPSIVMDALNNNFEDYDIKKMELAATGNGTVYEFEIEKGESKMEVVIDAKGNIIKKEQHKEEDEDDMDND